VSIDSAGFAEFYQATRDDCLRVVFASVGDRPTAEDLVAEAFARAWARWHTASRHPAPAAWVVRTAFNARVSWWRRYRREVELPESGAETAGLDGAVDRELVDRTLMAALLRLPARQREVVALRIFLDLDTAGTAQTLGIAPGTVTAHLARAMAALREELSGVIEQEQR
jgi:RNA polymerase sigma-70 factor (sigma-E family)